MSRRGAGAFRLSPLEGRGRNVLTSESWSADCSVKRMTTDVRKAEIHDLLERHHAHYEVRPYYLIWDQRPEGAPEVEKKSTGRVRSGPLCGPRQMPGAAVR